MEEEEEEKGGEEGECEVGRWRKGLVGVPNHEHMNTKLGGLCTTSSPTYSLCLHYIFTLINTLN